MTKLILFGIVLAASLISISESGTAVKEEECRRVCSPRACTKIKCPLIPNAVCVNDVCGCSAFFIQRQGKNLIDVTDFCGQRMRDSWQLPSAGSPESINTGQSQPVLPAVNQVPLPNTLPTGCRFVCSAENDMDIQDGVKPEVQVP